MSGEGDLRSHLELRINFREIGQISANALVVALSRLFPLESIEYLVYGYVMVNLSAPRYHCIIIFTISQKG